MADRSGQRAAHRRHKAKNNVARDRLLRKLQVAAGPLHDRIGTHGAGGLCDRLSIPEQIQRRYASDTQSSTGGLRRVGIQLQQTNARFQRRRRTLKLWRHASAGAAPRCPDVEQDRYAVGAEMLFQSSFVDFGRVSGEQRRFAPAAARRSRRTLGRHTIHCATGWADDLLWNGHGGSNSRFQFDRYMRTFVDTQYGGYCTRPAADG